MIRPARSRPVGGLPAARIAVQQLIRYLRRCEAGQGLVEYAIVIALIAVGLFVILLAFRDTVGGVMNRTSEAMSFQARGEQASPSLQAGPPSRAAPGPTGDSSAGNND